MTAAKHLNISDHELIFVTRKMLPKVIDPKQRTDLFGRSYRNYSKETIQGDLLNMDWTNLYASNNPDEAWNIMIKHITQTLDRYCPLKNIRIQNMKDPWLTNELLELIVDKDRLLETAKSTNNPNDWITARQATNRLKDLTKRAKSIYF